MEKNKLLLLSAFLIALFFSSANLAHALEVPLPTLGDDPTLPQYVVFLFSWAISIAGVLALISFVVGAVGLIASGDNPELAGNSKDRMKGAVLGLVLVIASFLILKTINPALITPTPTPLTPVVIPTSGPPPGIYLYPTTSNCSGAHLGVMTSSQDSITSAFNGQVESVQIINDPDNELYYGVILHTVAGLENAGRCSPPITKDCTPINMIARAADIFAINDQDPTTSGNGVTFYSNNKAFGWNTGGHDGRYDVPNTLINPVRDVGKDSMIFDYTNVPVPLPYQLMCMSYWTCPGSIHINGNYLVAIYSKNGGFTNCQTFVNNVDDLNTEPILGPGSTRLSDIYIIATQ